jgi:hypothetical protein
MDGMKGLIWKWCAEEVVHVPAEKPSRAIETSLLPTPIK